jgi:hypothetical protein
MNIQEDRHMKRICVLTATALSLLCALQCETHAADAATSFFTSAVDSASLDPAAYAEWFDGKEIPLTQKRGPEHSIWTPTSHVEWSDVKFGDSKTPGPRHLRIGFKTSIDAGSVVVRGGGRLSVLKPDATYPGDLNDESQWLSGERIDSDGGVTRDEAGNDDFSVWVLPPGTRTRALRFSHAAQTADPNYSGNLSGVFVLSERVANVGPQATASASARNEAAHKIVNGNNDRTWGAWDNGKEGGSFEISKDHPETLLLVWPGTVNLRGLNALWAGFGAAEIQAYSGPADRHPREAAESDWQTVANAEGLQNWYPLSFGVNWIDFGKVVSTRAVRLRLTQVSKEGHPHLNGNTRKGKRVWLGELLALQPLGDKELKSAILPPAVDDSHPPIAIKFTLKEPGFVTLVLDDENGKRVRNLISETPFPAGENTAWWDGTDDLLRDPEAARHGIYHIPSQFVQPGAYRVRGLYRKAVELHYEFSGYAQGNPPWPTADHTGGWLTNHTPPSSALFVPADKAPGGKALVFLGSYVAEGGDGLAWVDLDGNKQGGKGWIGGNWTGAPYLAFDAGADAIAGIHAYVGSAWEGDLRLTALSDKGEKPVVKYKFEGGKPASAMNGIAVRNGLLLCTLPKQNQVLFVDVKGEKVLGAVPLQDPHGLTFDAQGNLLLLAGKQLLRYPAPAAAEPFLGAPQTLVSNLEDPQHVAVDANGNLYVSDRGSSHQVKVFSADGKAQRAIGVAGTPRAGPYDPNHMNNPNGIAVDDRNQLWVAETDFQPKRVSVWTLDGKLLRAYYGPAEYGGGGKVDPKDKTRFYYHGMEFKLDWEKGTSTLAQVLYRPGENDLKPPGGHSSGQPEEPFYVNGKRYFSNCYNSNPTNGASIAMLWLDVNGIAVPVAALGRANDWDALKTDALKPSLPEGVDLKGDYWKNQAVFCWSDLNGDGQLQPDEVAFAKKSAGGITVMPDLSFVASRIDGVATRFAPKSFTDRGVPVYDFNAGETLLAGAQNPTSSGGDQALVADNGWTILTVGPKPFAPQSMGGAYKGEAKWSYPSPWPGLHASHESAAPELPGQIIGTTRLLGGFVTPKNSNAGPLWAINGNQGNMYLFTADGLFVSTLFKDVRQGALWRMPLGTRNMDVTNLSLHDENFWPSITQASDGQIYLVDGANTCIVRIDNLETISRLPDSTVNVSADDLAKGRAYFWEREVERQKRQGQGTLNVALRSDAPAVDGKADDWKSARWVDIDKSGVAAYFNSNSKPHDVTAAVAVSGGKLYAFFRTGEKDLLRNSGETPNAPFKNGGALDIMIGANPKADANRGKPAEGDLRLLVTVVKKKTLALLYRAVVPGTKEGVPFSSPWRTITIDRVDDVSAEVEFAADEGNFEIAIPLEKLGLKPANGQTIRGDIGILRGDGTQTVQRVYWSNKATGITADVPSEAELTPKLWGTWKFE